VDDPGNPSRWQSSVADRIAYSPGRRARTTIAVSGAKRPDVGVHLVTLSVIIPAYNEEHYLPQTLQALHRAQLHYPCEIVVVDNNSTDRTAAVAAEFGARVVQEHIHNIAAVRNVGASAATGRVLVFIDADTVVDPATLQAIAEATEYRNVVGGAVAVTYTPFRRAWVAWYIKGWAFWGRVVHMALGAAQFCRSDVFRDVGGYDESIYVGEDIDFYWRMRRQARRIGGTVRFLDTARVLTSSRRFDTMAPLKLLLVTHPLLILVNWRRRRFWKDWYERAIR
jgi:glycosyltransferase involved in cell wall biosynthesis